MSEEQVTQPKKKVKDMTPEELRAYNLAAQHRSRKAKREIAEKEFREAECNEKIGKKDAFDVLTERGIVNRHVQETVYELAELAAREHKIPFNDYLVRHGLRATLSESSLEDTGTEAVTGELINHAELYALWDFSLNRHPEITFEKFLELRHVCKTDCFRLGKEILGKDFHDSPHGVWANYFPQFNPDTLRSDYDQEAMKLWLDSQSEKKDYLLLASRNCYKSSFAVIWIVSAILCCPDLRCLLVSETTPLSKGFIRQLRGYFEIQNTNNPTLFNSLFPEMMIPAGEGTVLNFQSPMARLGLIQNTAQSTSMDSSVAGQRADILLFDDPISNLTTGNEDIRQSGVDRFDLVQKLREVGGISATLGTPWHEQDLYATLLKRNEEDDDKPLQFRIDPAWKVKPEFADKKLADLEESDVTLLFPTRLTWKFLQKERKSNERFFRSQNLVEFLPDEDAAFKINFEEDVLRASIVALKDVPVGDNVIGVDIAFSQSKYADNSAICVARIWKNDLNEMCMTVLECLADRYRMSEVALHIAMFTQKYNPRTVLIEKAQSADLIQAEINRAAIRCGVGVPAHFVPISTQKGNKLIRLKGLETLLMAGRLKFASGEYIDRLFNELGRQDGKKSSSGKKDDQCDALGIIQRFFAPAITVDNDTDLEESRKILKAQRDKALMQSNYGRIFGQTDAIPMPSLQEPYRHPLQPIWDRR
jgi:Terminase RNaseH-like domain